MFDALHHDRKRAQSFGQDALNYDRARPSYPADLVADLVRNAPRDVLDVGCGTGIASRLLKDRGLLVLGVEPDERMAEVARQSGVDVEISTFEDWDPCGRLFDLVISAQAWHWVDPRLGTAKAGAVLPPGGRIACFWNVGRHEPALRSALDVIYQKHMTELDTYSIVLGHPIDDRLERATASIVASGLFDSVEQRSFAWEKTYTKDEWLDHLPTHSDHRALAPEKLNALLGAIGNAIDEGGGTLTMYYETILLSSLRR